MGQYVLSSQKHGGHPVYRKGFKFLYRSSESGKWAVCDREDHIHRNWARIRSTDSAERPTQNGLRWRYDAGVVLSSFKDDPAIKCVDRAVTWAAGVSPAVKATAIEFGAPLQVQRGSGDVCRGKPSHA